MANSTSSSQVTLIPLEETSEQVRTTNAPQDGQIRPLKNQEKGKRPKNVWLKSRRKRKVAHDFGEENGKIQKLQKADMAEKVKDSGQLEGNGIKKSPKNDSNSDNSIQENLRYQKDKNSFLLWLKSAFVRRNHTIDVNKSYKSKLTYFVYVLPAFILHPAALKEYSDPKLDEDFKLRLAAIHIDDALNGRGRFGKARAALKSRNVERCFKIYSSKYWEYMMYLFITLQCLLPIWEQSPTPVSVGDRWPHWDISVAVLVVNALCIIVYLIDIGLAIAFLSWKHFWTAKENFWMRVECIFTLLFLVDFVVLVVEKIYKRRLVLPFRCLRAAMLICKSKNVAHIFKVLVSIMSRLGKVFAIIFIFIFTFASIGLHLYMETYHVVPEICTNSTTSWNCTSVYSGAFDHVAIASLHMFVLMSTENYPDVMIPAFDVSVSNFFYFMFYLYAGVFFLTAILLAIIVESYWEYSKKHVKMERLRQREELVKAWNLLDPGGVGFLSIDDPKLLNLFKILRPKNSDEENLDLIAYISDNNDELIIDSYDWTTRLVETLYIEFEPEEVPDVTTGRSQKSALAKIRRTAHTIIHAKGVGITVLVLILLHSILFCLMWSGISDVTQLVIQIMRSVIILFFMIEVILRILSDSVKLLNILDLLDISMVVIAIAGNIIWYILWYVYDGVDKVIYVGACVVASSLAVLGRLLFNSEQARTAVYILRSIYPVMFDLILLVVTMIFFYAIIGLEIFQDKNTQKSTASGFTGSYTDYGCGVGFDTFGCAAMVVFQIVTTNDWHQIMLGAMIDAGWPSSIYFVSCYLIIDMIVMNLFVAISIEAYKKLARDRRDLANLLNVPDTLANDEGVHANQDSMKADGFIPSKDIPFKVAAKNAITGLFASTRTSKNSISSSTHVGATTTPYMGRRGTRGSVTTISLPRTPQIDRDSSEEDLTITSRRSSIPGTPIRRSRSIHGKPDLAAGRRRSVASPTDSAIMRRRSGSVNENGGRGTPTRVPVDKRQGAMKARSDRRRQERKAQKQVQHAPTEKEQNQLQVPEPKLSISDIVKLKKTVKVLLPYRARSPVEMSLEEGQVVSVTEENGHMLRGPGGWFPKTHTRDFESRFMRNHLPDDTAHIPTSAIRKPGDGKTKVVNFKVENEVISEDSQPTGSQLATGSSHAPVQHRPSIGRMRRKTDATDWRREILGDMTVMNKDEMQELNKQLKGGLHTRMRRNMPYRPQSFNTPSRVEEIPEETEELPEVPEVTVSEAPQPTQASSDSNEDTLTSKTGTLTLTVPGSSPKKPKRRRDGGEMPVWMKNFVAEKGLSVAENLKIDESGLPSAGSSDEDDHLSGFNGILVHRSDTSTGSSSDDLQSIAVIAVKDQTKPENSARDSDALKNGNSADGTGNLPSITQTHKTVHLPRKGVVMKPNVTGSVSAK